MARDENTGLHTYVPVWVADDRIYIAKKTFTKELGLRLDNFLFVSDRRATGFLNEEK